MTQNGRVLVELGGANTPSFVEESYTKHAGNVGTSNFLDHPPAQDVTNSSDWSNILYQLCSGAAKKLQEKLQKTSKFQVR